MASLQPSRERRYGCLRVIALVEPRWTRWRSGLIDAAITRVEAATGDEKGSTLVARVAMPVYTPGSPVTSVRESVPLPPGTFSPARLNLCPPVGVETSDREVKERMERGWTGCEQARPGRSSSGS
jgi:hypothetical protein